MKTININPDDGYNIDLNIKSCCRDCGEELILRQLNGEECNNLEINYDTNNFVAITADCPKCKSSYGLHINLNGAKDE